MTEIHLLALHQIMKYLSISICIYFIAELAKNDKNGWGWLIFLAICLSSTSINYSKK